MIKNPLAPWVISLFVAVLVLSILIGSMQKEISNQDATISRLEKDQKAAFALLNIGKFEHNGALYLKK